MRDSGDNRSTYNETAGDSCDVIRCESVVRQFAIAVHAVNILSALHREAYNSSILCDDDGDFPLSEDKE